MDNVDNNDDNSLMIMMITVIVLGNDNGAQKSILASVLAKN
jgi:hypothetical protein